MDVMREQYERFFAEAARRENRGRDECQTKGTGGMKD